jgi:hypothetical protein
VHSPRRWKRRSARRTENREHGWETTLVGGAQNCRTRDSRGQATETPCFCERQRTEERKTLASSNTGQEKRTGNTDYRRCLEESERSRQKSRALSAPGSLRGPWQFSPAQPQERNSGNGPDRGNRSRCALTAQNEEPSREKPATAEKSGAEKWSPAHS